MEVWTNDKVRVDQWLRTCVVKLKEVWTIASGNVD